MGELAKGVNLLRSYSFLNVQVADLKPVAKRSEMGGVPGKTVLDLETQIGVRGAGLNSHGCRAKSVQNSVLWAL
jgi:hypothetical protein